MEILTKDKQFEQPAKTEQPASKPKAPSLKKPKQIDLSGVEMVPSKNILIIGNQRCGLHIEIHSDEPVMSLFNYAFNIKANFFDEVENDK